MHTGVVIFHTTPPVPGSLVVSMLPGIYCFTNAFEAKIYTAPTQQPQRFANIMTVVFLVVLYSYILPGYYRYQVLQSSEERNSYDIDINIPVYVHTGGSIPNAETTGNNCGNIVINHTTTPSSHFTPSPRQNLDRSSHPQ